MANQTKQPRHQQNTASSFLESLKNQSLGQRSEHWLDKKDHLRRVFSERVQRSEQEVYNSRNRQLSQETEMLLGEIKKELEELKKTKIAFTKNVEKAVARPPQKASLHHVGFLQHIKKIIFDLRRTVENSSDWLVAWSGRQQKKGPFWNTFLNRKRGGTQFLLSSEHYMTRSAG